MFSASSPHQALGVPGFVFADLHAPDRLAALHEQFARQVAAREPELWARWQRYADAPSALGDVERSAVLVAMAPHVSRFLAQLFSVGAEAERLVAATRAYDDLFRFKIDFVRRRALPLLKGGGRVEASDADHAAVARILTGAIDAAGEELALARAGCALLDREEAARTSGDHAALAEVTTQIDAMRRWCAAHLHDPARRSWVVFRFPDTLDPEHLVHIVRPDPSRGFVMTGPEADRRRRDGFALTDARFAHPDLLSEIHYCVLCHERDKDSCSKGIVDKQGAVTSNALGIPLAGCPLDEKISEMHLLRKSGDALGALALVMVDNPMCPGTGHRICNDCMRACIYQKQEPVNIPQIETGVLTDVLGLPWGVEIYGLLTRWNPLNVARPFALPYNGKNVLVVGLGPAGYTLAHYLLNEGFGVVAIDGLKIEAPDATLVGGLNQPPAPVERWTDLYQALDERVLEGFGGVSEYGITVRWDKNFLSLIHLTLARRSRLKIYGGVRFGGALPIDDVWEHGFHHIAIAAGAGRPTIIDLKHNLIRGIRKASDFLMALQLTGAFKDDGFANLQVRLPAVVIGGGLTGVDTATELFAYYPLQVEKILDRHEALVAALGPEAATHGLDTEERAILDEFLAHGRAVRAERARAAAAGDAPDFAPLVRAWGGVTLAYRKRLQDAPAYRLNYEEVEKAFEEGIAFAEQVEPVEAVADEHGHIRALVCTRRTADDQTERVELPARAVLVAAGTAPNVTYEREYPGTFALDRRGRFFKGHRVETSPDGSCQLVADDDGFFTSYARDERFISYYGDNHPRYNGNVVKAMASAKHGYTRVVDLFAPELRAMSPAQQATRDAAWTGLVGRLDDALLARVERVVRLTPTIIEVIVRAPAAARHFQPGQFYRLQNFERSAARLTTGGATSSLVMEGVALTGAWVDRERGLLSLITLEMGVSSRLCAYLQPGEPVVVMGPTGAPTEIPANEAVLLAGGGLGNAVLFSIARALKARGSRVLYFAGYKNGADLFKRDEIEAATDQVVWATDTGVEIAPSRPQDHHFRGNIVQAMVAFAEGRLGTAVVPMAQVQRIIAIGSDRMMHAVRDARHGVLAPHLQPGHAAIGSINSPMQCMMKEVCAQCLQRHVDPVTGREEFVFSCFNQDQELDRVDFENLRARLRQNSVEEKVADKWLAHVLAQAPEPLKHV